MTVSGWSYSSAAPATIRPGHALAVAGAIGPTLSIFAYKGLAPLFFAVAAVELILFWRDHRRLPRPAPTAAVLLGAFVVWGAIGSSWSLDPEASWATAGKLALMTALGLPLVAVARDLESSDRERVRRASLAGITFGLALMAIEVFFGMPITHAINAALHLPHAVGNFMLNPAATVLVLIAAVVTGDLLHRRHLGWAICIGMAAVLLAILSQSMAAGLAGIAAVLVLPAIAWGGPRTGRAFAALAAVAIVVAPVLPSRVLGPAKEFHWPRDAIPSVYQRIAIWQFTETRIDERPVIGWGLDAARRIPGGHDGIKAESLHIQNPVMRGPVANYFNSGNIEQMPLHPHNAALQIWLETGGVGAALAAAFVFIVLATTARQWPVNQAATAGALACAISALLIAGLSYGIWQTWWLATLWLVAAFAQPVNVAGEPG
jgi:O-antigen ligase